MAHHIRIGTQGWNGKEAAKTADEAGAGIGARWLEIDGYRIPENAFVGASLTVSDNEFTTPVVTLIGTVEIVYVDNDGSPLP